MAHQEKSKAPAGAARSEGVDRRSFLRANAQLFGSAAFLGAWEALAARTASGGPARGGPSPEYGSLGPVNDENTGLPLLLLPEGFRYVSGGWTNDPMEDDVPTPAAHDGMAIGTVKGPQLTLIRNHEVRATRAAFGGAPVYDPMSGGGTTNLVFNTRKGAFERSYASLAGTSTNCAGGPTPWGSWLTCEETILDPAPDGLTRTHGWVFDVPADRAATAEPLTAMGRFVHEAVAVDPRTGVVYETEDQGASGFYRFIPQVPGALARGGRLQMLKVVAEFQKDLRGAIPTGSKFAVEWVDIAEPERAHVPGTTNGLGVFRQGFDQGGAVFARLEGAWYGSGRIYFVSTSGGRVQEGQLWEYDTQKNWLRLLFESPSQNVLDNPDNVTVSPRGGILMCEDGDLSGQRLQQLTPGGTIYPFAANNVVLNGTKGFTGDFRGFEWAGACFSPDGRWLFANIQTPGITFAITGPWERGSL